MISLYGKSTNDRETWSNQFKNISNFIVEKNLENIYFMADFNFVTSTLDRNSHTLNNVDEIARDSWNSLEESLEIVDSFRVNNPSELAYTYTHTNKISMSRIDRIFVPTSISSKIVRQTFAHSQFGDHKILRLKIAANVERGEGHWTFNDQLLNDEVFNAQMTTEILNMENYKQYFANSRDFFDDIKQTIHSTARAYAIKRANKRRTEVFALKKNGNESKGLASTD